MMIFNAQHKQVHDAIDDCEAEAEEAEALELKPADGEEPDKHKEDEEW